jgi:hypothetical protein
MVAMENANDPIMKSSILKAKSRQEVAAEYGISVRTLNRWFKKVNLDIPSGLIDPLHSEIIYQAFGKPKRH